MNPSLQNVAESAAAAGDVARAAAEATAALAHRLTDLEQEVAHNQSRAPVAIPRDQLAAAIVGNSAFEKFRTELIAGNEPLPVRFAVPTLSNDISHTTAPISRPDFVPGIIGQPYRRPRVVDLLPKHKATTNSVIYLRESATTNNAAPVSELTRKPESVSTFEEIEAPVITLPHYARASRQILADVPGLQNFIGTRLLQGLAEKREAQIMLGSGAGENLDGLLHQAGAAQFVGHAGDASGTWRGNVIERPTRVDVIRCAIADVEIGSGMPADAIVMHPTDIAAIELQKDLDERYTTITVAETGTKLLTHMWQRPVVSSINVAPGEYLVGAFQAGAALYVRDEAAVELGYAENDFTENAVRILAEERVAMPCWQPACFIKGAF